MKIVNLEVHRFTVSDVDDPELYAGEPLLEWERSEAGQWIMENAVDTPYWARYSDPSLYGYVFSIVAKLTEKDATYYNLKWGIK